MNRSRRRLTYANVVASLSLFIALGGGAYAAVAITSEDIVDETIQSQDIAAEAVGTADIGKQAVTLDRMHDYSVNGAKVLDNSLSGPDVANGSLTGWDVADGSLTDRNLAYDAVQSGNVADRSLRGNDIADDSLTGRQIDLNVVKVTAPSGPENTDQWKTAEARCPATYSVIAGGGRPTFYSISNDTTRTFDQAHLASSRPSESGQGWTVSANDSYRYDDDQERDEWRLTAYAFCAKL